MFLAKLNSARELLARFPNEPEVRPKKVNYESYPNSTGSKSARVAVQLVYDKFYFLLFREVITEIRYRTDIAADLLIVQSINGGVGLGLKGEIAEVITDLLVVFEPMGSSL